MSRVIHFEVSADDPHRAGAFYAGVFGWNIQKWDGPQDYWLVMTGKNGEPGIDGGLMQRMEGMPPTVNTVDVPSLDECVAKITALGGRVVVPKMEIPGVGYLAYCHDTEGNTFGVMEGLKEG